MFSLADIRHKNILVVNVLEGMRFNFSLGNIVIKNMETEEVLTKVVCAKVLAILVIGNFTITSQTLEHCHKYGIHLIMMKSSFRSYFSVGNNAEANYLLRQRQYTTESSFDIAKAIIENKIINQLQNLKDIRQKSDQQQSAISRCQDLLAQLHKAESLAEMMGVEGNVAKIYFSAYFDMGEWKGRKPRAKIDPYNVLLDIGYTFVFNLIETCARIFGFDLYKGFCHQGWYKRKSLICDFVEPFRCIIDRQMKKSFNLKQFQHDHFEYNRYGQCFLGKEHEKLYTQILMTTIIDYKEDIFVYVRDFYRAFMSGKAISEYPVFTIKE